MSHKHLTVLHLDDEVYFLKAVKNALNPSHSKRLESPNQKVTFEVHSFSSLPDLLKCKLTPDILLLDYCLEPDKEDRGITGLSAAKECSTRWPTTVMVLMTSKSAKEVINLSHLETSGIHDFYNKSTALGALSKLLLSTYNIASAKCSLKEVKCTPKQTLPSLAGKTLPEFIESLSPLIQNEQSLFIQGEVGTGKRTLISSLLCFLGKDANIVRINSAQSKPSEIRAAFLKVASQASKTSQTAWLVVEEISHLSASLQKQLKSLVSPQFGQSSKSKSKVVLLATSSVELHHPYVSGNFSYDLLSQFNYQIKLPPLRERSEEIEDLIHYWLIRENPAYPRVVMNGALECLKSYPWPKGNVHELFQTLKSMLNIQAGGTLTSISLPRHIRYHSSKTEMVQLNQTQIRATTIPIEVDPTFSRPFEHYMFDLLSKLIAFSNLHHKHLGKKLSMRDLSRLLHIPRTTLKRQITELERLNLVNKEY